MKGQYQIYQWRDPNVAADLWLRLRPRKYLTCHRLHVIPHCNRQGTARTRQPRKSPADVYLRYKQPAATLQTPGRLVPASERPGAVKAFLHQDKLPQTCALRPELYPEQEFEMSGLRTQIPPAVKLGLQHLSCWTLSTR